MFRFQEEALSGLYSIYPSVFKDERGYFFEAFQSEKYNVITGGQEFVQDNISKSSKGILRGLHFQKPPFAQGKLVQVLQGSVLDIAVDLRRNSATYGQSFKKILSADNAVQLYIPPGFAHGFYTLEDHTLFSYKCTAPYHAASEGCILWNDPALKIDWELFEKPILSEKDKLGASFSDFETPFL